MGSQTKMYRYHAYLATQWMKGTSLKELVANKVDYSKTGNDEDSINNTIVSSFMTWRMNCATNT